MLKLFNYAIILQPKTDKEGEVTEEAQLLVEPETVLARDTDQATVMAHKKIPDEHMTHLDRVTVVVSPF